MDRLVPPDPIQDMKDPLDPPVQLETRNQDRLGQPDLKAQSGLMDPPVRAEHRFQVIILKSRAQMLQGPRAHIITGDFH